MSAPLPPRPFALPRLRAGCWLPAPVLCLALCLALLPAPATADPAALRAALARSAAQDWEGATMAARPGGAVAADIVEWQRLRAGEGRLGDYEGFLARRPDWPGLDWLHRRGEVAVARSETPSRVIAYFDGARPATAQGGLALIRALRGVGRDAEAGAEALRLWQTMPLGEEEEAAILALYGASLRPHHAARLDRMLWDGHGEAARRMLPRVPEDRRRLAEARLALRADTAGVDVLIAAVPEALATDPGLAHERFEWRMRRDRTEDAIALLREHSAGAGALGRPAAWAARRIALVRGQMRAGEAALAYELAANHHLSGGTAFADLEFLAGYVALTGMRDPDRALTHFRALAAGVSSPISLSRAFYWEGRAEEAAGRSDAARAAFTRAAGHQTAFYGLLAAERAGIALDPALLGGETFPDWRAAGFMRSPVMEAALMLHRAGDRGLARRFVLHLAEGLADAELGPLADLMLAIGEPNFALQVAKQAAARGVILPRAYFPVADALPEGLAVERALALAIARRESEFDPAVISPAGARGLMQVMPGTAQLVAEQLSLPYEAGRLLSDPAYNATLGSAYLAGLIEEFGPALTLVAAGYNAGPGRPRTWIGTLGDPRAEGADPVAWIEAVPFAETRNYIMRVAESLVIYRARLAGEAGPVVLSDLLTGRAR